MQVPDVHVSPYAFAAQGTGRRGARGAQAVLGIARANTAPEVKPGAVLGRAAHTFPGLADFVDVTEVAREHARGIVLVGVRLRFALAGGRIAADGVALVEG
jgi:hypothetical protein